MTSEFAVETLDLVKVYRSGTILVPALRGVDLKVRRREFISIVGPSGSGKSTLLNMLGALDKPTSGHVLIDGVDIFTLSNDQLASFRNREIGFIFQAHNLIMRTSVIRNVELPLIVSGAQGRTRRRRASQLLERVGLGDKINRRPTELSGGEQQRVAVARALVNEPAIILGDEPTGNLDSKTGGEVVGLMRKMVEELGTTFIVVTHNPEVANATDRVIVLRDGQIAESIDNPLHEEVISPRKKQ